MSYAQPSFRMVRVKKTLEIASGGKFGLGLTPIVRRDAYTQTYATAARTVPNATATAVSTAGGTATSPFGYVTLAQANAIVTAVNALIDDALALRKTQTAIIDDLQAFGLAG